MTVQQLIDSLSKINPDNEITVSVHDYYSVYGADAEIIFHEGLTSGDMATMTNDKYTSLQVSLSNYKEFDGTRKHPKITYRK